MHTGERVEADPCIVCDTTARDVLANQGRDHADLLTVICPGCGMVSHHPLPDAAAVAAFYERDYRIAYKGAAEPRLKHVLRAQRGAIARAQRLQNLLSPGAAVLDIGASSGEFTYVMSRLGFAATGMEPNLGYGGFARRTYGVAVQDGGYEAAPARQGGYQMIVLNHVFEHLTDPGHALARFHALLAEDGLLFLEVPNLLGVQKRAATLFHTAHIWNFTPQTLVGLAARHGFAPLPNQDMAETSLVFRRLPAPLASPPDPTLAPRLQRQVATEQRSLAYLLSGMPFIRRWHRLCRNIEEHWTVRRHAGVRAMADALIAAAFPAPAPPAGPTPAPAQPRQASAKASQGSDAMAD
jgi:SAM-dependent methyltransferase